MQIERECAQYFAGRLDGLGGYVRFRFDGQGIAFRQASEPITHEALLGKRSVVICGWRLFWLPKVGAATPKDAD